MCERRLLLRSFFFKVPSVCVVSSVNKVFSVNGGLRRTSTLLNSFHYRKVRSVTEDVVNPLEKVSVLDKGALHVVSVPIGNLKDFTYRAVDVLRKVDYIVTSDRPATKTLLDLIHIPNQGRLIHYSANNKALTSQKLVEMLRGGRSMALVTTSGTPCIGDIGAELVQTMLRSGVRVTAVPGASSVLAALSCCGETRSPHEESHLTSENEGRDLRSDFTRLLSDTLPGSFFFGNMLPSSSSARLRVLRNVVGPALHPCVFYEIPRRLLLTLEDIATVLPGRRIYITHELTKLNESIHADEVEKLLVFYRTMEAQPLIKLGQLALVIAGASPKDTEQWMNRIRERRRRFRPDVIQMLTSSSSFALSDSSEKAKKMDSVASESQKKVRKKRKKGKLKKNQLLWSKKPFLTRRNSQKVSRGKNLQRELRLRELKKIDEIQESLRLSYLANETDSQKLL